jgi:hypothetical protein
MSVGAIVFGTAVLATSAAEGSAQVEASVNPSNPVEQVVEQADNAYVAVFSPISSSSAATEGSGTQLSVASGAFKSDVSEFTSNFSVPVGSQTLEADSLSGRSTTTSGNSVNLSSGWSATPSEAAYVSPSALSSRNEVLVDSLFAPAEASQILTAANNINAEEAPLWENGLSSCSQQDCTITGAAGAIVTSFDSEMIGATSATVVATETLWQDDGGISPLTGVFTWTRSQGTFTSTDQLELSASGNWLVTSHDLTQINQS